MACTLQQGNIECNLNGRHKRRAPAACALVWWWDGTRKENDRQQRIQSVAKKGKGRLKAMEWLEQVQTRYKRKNQILFTKQSDCLLELRGLLEKADHRVAVLWAFALAEETVTQFSQRYPNELRPGQALSAARLWAEGKIKMPAARPAILACHAAAKDMALPQDAARCHAVGQACSVVHTAGHALGFPLYDLTAVVLQCGVEHCAQAVLDRTQEYVNVLLRCMGDSTLEQGEWAAFLRR